MPKLLGLLTRIETAENHANKKLATLIFNNKR
jgi:hypothetical protein